MTPAARAIKAAEKIQGKVVRLPALEIQQQPDRRLYSFAVDGKHITDFATVSRVRRDEQQHLHGYQRPENGAHVAAIRRYLESGDSPMLPNAIVIAFDKRVTFEPADAKATTDHVRPGHLIIPVDETVDDADKPGFIVDGQQRCAAIRDAQVDSFLVCVTAFITDELAEQRSQFILVNSTKALPKGLIHELLPGTTGSLPGPLMVRQLPATLVEQLNFDEDSPMYRRIQTPTNPRGVIKDNSVLRMLESSLAEGALYRYRGSDKLPQVASMYEVVRNYWSAVAEVFEEAWKDRKPRDSRLVHGAGIISMGMLMDSIMRRRPNPEPPSKADFIEELAKVKDECHWTSGVWHFESGTHRRWNDVQNTSRDIRLLTDYLLGLYRGRVALIGQRESVEDKIS